jgi:hypothetical protein
MLADVLGTTFLFLSGIQQEHPEPPIGTRIPHSVYEEEQVDPASRAEAFGVVQRIGECLVSGDPQGSMLVMATVLSSPAAGQALTRLRPRLPDCLVTAAQGTGLFGTLKLEIKESTLRGAIAGALYRLQFLSRPPASLGTPTAIALIIPPQESDPKDAQLVAAYAFAQCVTQSQPATVRDLVLSKIGSNQESETLAKLAPFMPPCASSGTTIRTDRNSLRLMLADSLYRWSITAAQEPPRPPVK